jgi:hypothetical protein
LDILQIMAIILDDFTKGILAMKAVSIACVCIALISAPAWACRGTAEYPQVAAQLAQSNPPEAESLAKRLQAGEALHRRGHESGSKDLMMESLKVLDEIKAKIAK